MKKGLLAWLTIGLLILWMAGTARAASFVLYDGSLNGGNQTPNQQQMTYTGLATYQSASGGITTLNTMANVADGAEYVFYAPGILLDRAQGFTISFTMRINSEYHTYSERAGFALYFSSSDGYGQRILFWQNEIWEGGAAYHHGQGVTYNTTSGFVTYDVYVKDNQYTISANGQQILAGLLELSGSPNSPNSFGLTDGSGAASVNVGISKIELNATSTVSGAVISLPRTGQTKCYDASGTEIACAGTGQDGETRAGTAWPSPRFTAGTGTEADCITDNLTGLMWTKNGNPMNGKTIWSGAIDYANGLTLCGYTDWRLPNVNEMESLSHADASDPAAWLNAQGFTNVQSGMYFSSSIEALHTDYRWVINMGGGDWGTHWQSSSDYAWPVRTVQSGSFPTPTWKTGQTTPYRTGDDGDLKLGVAWPSPRFIDNGNGTVKDNLTGLAWAKDAQTPGPSVCGPAASKPWQGALDYIKCLNTQNYLGHSDWRLPNRKELRSLADYSRHTPSLPSGHPFTNVQSNGYWSSTTKASTNRAWFVHMGYGYPDVNDKTGSYHVWPVRGGQIADTTAPTGTITINSGASYTNSLSVSLALTCADAGGCSQMQFSNENANWSTPEAYATTRVWSLLAGDGAKTVYAKFKDNADNWSQACSATILLDTSAPSTSPSIPGGTYTSAQTVTLNAGTGTTIYYTTDGSDPATSTTRKPYTEAIPILSTTTLKYYAVDAAGNAETVKTELYSFRYPLVVTKNGAGSGIITSSPAGIDCGDTCSASFVSGASVTLVSQPITGYAFNGWSGACTGTSPSCALTMDSAKDVIGTFFSIAPIGSAIDINFSAAVTSGAAVTLSLTCALPETCVAMQFSNDGGATWSMEEAYSNSKSWDLLPGDGRKTVSARFKNADGHWSPVYSDTILLAHAFARGDVNLDGEVNLSDAIIALRIMAGMAGPMPFADTDVNGDKKIGLADALYILQLISDLRQVISISLDDATTSFAYQQVASATVANFNLIDDRYEGIVDGTIPVTISRTSPSSIAWLTPLLSDGNHTLTVKFDNNPYSVSFISRQAIVPRTAESILNEILPRLYSTIDEEVAALSGIAGNEAIISWLQTTKSNLNDLPAQVATLSSSQQETLAAILYHNFIDDPAEAALRIPLESDECHDAQIEFRKRRKYAVLDIAGISVGQLLMVPPSTALGVLVTGLSIGHLIDSVRRLIISIESIMDYCVFPKDVLHELLGIQSLFILPATISSHSIAFKNGKQHLFAIHSEYEINDDTILNNINSVVSKIKSIPQRILPRDINTWLSHFETTKTEDSPADTYRISAISDSNILWEKTTDNGKLGLKFSFETMPASFPVSFTFTLTDSRDDHNTVVPATLDLDIDHITLTSSNPTPEVGQTAQLTAKAYTSDNTELPTTTSDYTWTSSDDSIASVNNGVVTVHKDGMVTITATMNLSQKSKGILFNLAIDHIALASSNLSPGVGQTAQLTAKAYTSDNVERNTTAADYDWSSSDDSIASVSNGVVTIHRIAAVQVRATHKVSQKGKGILLNYTEASYRLELVDGQMTGALRTANSVSYGPCTYSNQTSTLTADDIKAGRCSMEATSPGYRLVDDMRLNYCSASRNTWSVYGLLQVACGNTITQNEIKGLSNFSYMVRTDATDEYAENVIVTVQLNASTQNAFNGYGGTRPLTTDSYGNPVIYSSGVDGSSPKFEITIVYNANRHHLKITNTTSGEIQFNAKTNELFTIESDFFAIQSRDSRTSVNAALTILMEVNPSP